MKLFGGKQLSRMGTTQLKTFADQNDKLPYQAEKDQIFKTNPKNVTSPK